MFTIIVFVDSMYLTLCAGCSVQNGSEIDIVLRLYVFCSSVKSIQGVKYRTQAWKQTTSDPSGLMPNYIITSRC